MGTSGLGHAPSRDSGEFVLALVHSTTLPQMHALCVVCILKGIPPWDTTLDAFELAISRGLVGGFCFS